MIIILALLFWAIWSRNVGQAFLFAGLIACVVSSIVDLFCIEKKWEPNKRTPEMINIINHTATFGDYCIVFVSDIIGSFISTFLYIPTRMQPYYIIILIITFFTLL